MPQPRRQPPSQQPPSAAAAGAALAGASLPASSGAAGAAGVAVGAIGARKLIGTALKALTAVQVRIGRLRVARVRDALSSKGVPVADIGAVLREEERREREYRRRSAERVRRGLRLALAAPDASARAAAVESVLRREQLYARNRAMASTDRVDGALRAIRLERESPAGAYWRLGIAAQHTPDCLAMAGKFWPWSVLRKVRPPTHTGCVCELLSFGEAIATGLMTPDQVPTEAEAMRRAKPVIDFIRSQPGHELHEAARFEAKWDEELTLREQLAERGGDRNALAAIPFEIDRLLQLGHLLEAPENRSGAMVALYPSEDRAAQLAIPRGESPDELHITLAFLGDVSELSAEQHDAVVAAVRRWATTCPRLTGKVSGTGTFVGGPKPVTYLSVDLPDLPTYREQLVEALAGAGAPPSKAHGFTPHMTLDYARRRVELPGPVPLRFNRVAVVWGETRTFVPLTGRRVREGDPAPSSA